MTEMLFHIFERKALCCPKDISALDDLVHDFVYCLQLSLVLKVLRLFHWLLRFPRREQKQQQQKKHTTKHADTELCSTCNWPERQKGLWVAGRVQSPMPLLFGLHYHSPCYLGEGRWKEQKLWLVPTQSLQGRTCLAPALPLHPSPEPGLALAQGFPFIPDAFHPAAK